MSIEFSRPTVERPREVTIPPETTHEEQLRDALGSLNAHGYAIILGPSRAGKTTFLEHSLSVTLQENEYADPLFIDCMTTAPQDALEMLSTYKAPIILDETTRMTDDPAFLRSLKERVLVKRPTVICATLFGDGNAEAGVQALLTELLPDETEDTVIMFPASMPEGDAAKLIETIAPNVSAEFTSELTRLTTQPYLIRLILHEAQKDTQAGPSALAKRMLQNYPINQSLLPEARMLWKNVTSDSYPRWLLA